MHIVSNILIACAIATTAFAIMPLANAYNKNIIQDDKTFSCDISNEEFDNFIKGTSKKTYYEFSQKFFKNIDNVLTYSLNSYVYKSNAIYEYAKKMIIKKLLEKGLTKKELYILTDDYLHNYIDYALAKPSENPYFKALYRIGYLMARNTDEDNISSIYNQMNKSVLEALHDIGKSDKNLDRLPKGVLDDIIDVSVVPDSWYDFIDELGNDTNHKIDEDKLRKELKYTLEFFNGFSDEKKALDNVITTRVNYYLYKNTLNKLNELRSKLKSEMQALARQGYSNTKEYKALESQLADATNMFIDTMNTANQDLYLTETARNVLDSYDNLIFNNELNLLSIIYSTSRYLFKL